MQALIHGNFTGAAQKQVYALVGAAAAIAAAVGPLLGGFITTFFSWRIAFLLELVIIIVVLSGIKLVHDVPYTGSRAVDAIGAVLSVVGMGGIVLGILVWEEGGGYLGGARQRGSRSQLGSRIVRAVLRLGICGRHHACHAGIQFYESGSGQHRAAAVGQGAGRHSP